MLLGICNPEADFNFKFTHTIGPCPKPSNFGICNPEFSSLRMYPEHKKSSCPIQTTAFFITKMSIDYLTIVNSSIRFVAPAYLSMMNNT